MTENWYDKSIKQTEIKLNTDSSTGLKREAVKQRLKLYGENIIYPVKKSSFTNYLRHLLTDFTTVLMLITLMISAVYNKPGSIFVMLSILIVYYFIAIFTYAKAQEILEGLDGYSLPNAKVLRGGRLYMVKQKQLVRGDVIYVSAGDIVPCDARLVESDGLEVLEAALTSVPHAVRKVASFVSYRDIPVTEQKNLIFASTIVTKGTGKAICCETGDDTLVCKLKKNVNNLSRERLRIFDSIGNFCRKWTLSLTVIILILTVTDLVIGKLPDQGIYGSFMTGLTLAVGSMSEFFTAFAYIVLACGIYAAVNKKQDVTRGALIKNTSKLEKIKDLTCLILPREAAFNIHDMKLGKIYANGESYSLGEHGFLRNGARVMRYALISTGLYGAENLIHNNQTRENIYSAEEEAIISAAEECGEYNIELEKRYPMIQHISKGAGTRFDMTLVMYQSGYFVSLRGDYSAILNQSRYFSEDGRVKEMSPEKRNEIFVQADKLARESFHVIAVASKDTIYNNLNKRLSSFQTDLIFEGLIAIKEPMLPDAAKNIIRCKNAGLKVIMTCSDVSENNAIAAETLGLISSRDEIVTGEEISAMSDGIFKLNTEKYRVYQNLNYAQKRLLVKNLKANGERVGLLCNSLDEILLMRESDVGYAASITISENAENGSIDLAGRNIPIYTKTTKTTNASSCDSLKFVSDVIVSEPEANGTGGFNAIIDSVICSKSVYYNLLRMLRYMITSQLAKLIIVFASVFLGIVSLTPIQILFSGLVIDFSALIIIAFERTGYPLLKMPSRIGDKLTRPLISNLDCILIGIVWSALSVSAALIMRNADIISSDQITTCLFLSFIMSQIAVLNECKRETSIFNKNIRINGIYVVMLFVIALFITLSAVIPEFGMMFSIVKIPLVSYVGILSVPILITLFIELIKVLSSKDKPSSKGKFAVKQKKDHDKAEDLVPETAFDTSDIDISDIDFDAAGYDEITSEHSVSPDDSDYISLNSDNSIDINDILRKIKESEAKGNDGQQ